MQCGNDIQPSLIAALGMQAMEERIVISGIGVISPLGFSKEEFWQGLLNKATGIAETLELSHFADSARMVGKIANFKAKDYIKRPVLKPLDQVTRYCIAAAGKALQDANLEITDENRGKTAIIAGSMYQGIGCIFDFKKACYENGLTHLSPLFFPGIVFNSLSGQAAIEHKIQGPNNTIGNGTGSGLSAVTKAVEYIRSGKASAVIAGGAEMIHDFIFYKYDRLGRLSSPQKGAEKCSPFDKQRNGFILGEGGCFFVIEKESAAIARGASIHAVIENYHASHCAQTEKQPQVDALAACMEHGSQAQASAGPVSAIICDSSGCPELDAIEAEAIRKLYQEDGPVLTGNKANIGHTLGVSGAFNLCQGVMCLKEAQVPPIKNLDAPEIPLNYARVAVDGDIRRVLVNSLDFNRNYLTVCLGKP